MWFPTRAALDRALLLRILQPMDRENEPSAERRDSATPVPDPTMIYSMLTDCHRQLVTISRGVWLLVFIAALLCFRR